LNFSSVPYNLPLLLPVEKLKDKEFVQSFYEFQWLLLNASIRLGRLIIYPSDNNFIKFKDEKEIFLN
jgi:hypothetical protein